MIMISKEFMVIVCLENPPGPEGSNGIQNCGCWRGADWKRSRGNLSGHPARLKPVRLNFIHSQFHLKACLAKVNIITIVVGFSQIQTIRALVICDIIDLHKKNLNTKCDALLC